MSHFFDIGKMMAGVAFFLLAMNFMETSLRSLAGRKFKLFLKKETTNKIKAITGGAIATAFLQSSSIINLVVLSMVGAGVVQMENALALILGSNLGSTFNSWIVAVVGFNFNIDSFVLPVAGFTGICIAFINKETKVFLWFKFLFSLAFLFISLGFIKTGMEEFTRQTDLSALNNYPLIAFLGLGILLTTLVQSSSVTIALTLSALHTNIITLYAAMAIVLGSEIGTTFKLFLASARGLAVKKRVALGNFLFNLGIVSVVFLFLRPINHLIADVLKINDDLIALVFFQSLVNLGCILLFAPFLSKVSTFLLQRFSETEEESFFISKVPVADSELALEALEKETNHFIKHVIDYGLSLFDLEESLKTKDDHPKNMTRKKTAEKYDYIKQLHGEMHNFYLKLQNTDSDKPGRERLNQLISAIRNNMYAAKNLRDARHDIEQTRNSSNDIKFSFYSQSRQKLMTFSKQVITLLNEKNKENCFADLTAIYRSVTTGYTETLQLLYKESLVDHVTEMEISTLINFNRELYTYFKSMVFALKDYLLTGKEGEYFDTLPGFIR